MMVVRWIEEVSRLDRIRNVDVKGRMGSEEGLALLKR